MSPLLLMFATAGAGATPTVGIERPAHCDLRCSAALDGLEARLAQRGVSAGRPDAFHSVRIDGIRATDTALVIDATVRVAGEDLADWRFEARAPLRVGLPQTAQTVQGDDPRTIGGTFMVTFGGMAVLGAGLGWGLAGGKWTRAGRDSGRVLLLAVPVTVGGAMLLNTGLKAQRRPKEPEGPIYVRGPSAVDPWATEALLDEAAAALCARMGAPA